MSRARSWCITTKAGKLGDQARASARQREASAQRSHRMIRLRLAGRRWAINARRHRSRRLDATILLEPLEHIGAVRGRQLGDELEQDAFAEAMQVMSRRCDSWQRWPERRPALRGDHAGTIAV